jgi:hypothetical protein
MGRYSLSGVPPGSYRIAAGGWFPTTQDSSTQRVAPGRYRVEISGMPAGVYVKSIRLGGMDVTRRGLELSGGSTDLEIVLAQGSGQIAGTVADTKGRPVTGASVTLWPVSPDLSRPAHGAVTAKARHDGSFAFYNIPPREYYILAFEDVPEPGVELYPGFSVLSLVRPSKSGLTHPAAFLPRLDS